MKFCFSTTVGNVLEYVLMVEFINLMTTPVIRFLSVKVLPSHCLSKP